MCCSLLHASRRHIPCLTYGNVACLAYGTMSCIWDHVLHMGPCLAYGTMSHIWHRRICFTEDHDCFQDFPDAYLSIWPLTRFFSIHFFRIVYDKLMSQRPSYDLLVLKTVMSLSKCWLLSPSQHMGKETPPLGERSRDLFLHTVNSHDVLSCIWDHVLHMGPCLAYGTMSCIWDHDLHMGPCHVLYIANVACDRDASLS